MVTSSLTNEGVDLKSTDELPSWFARQVAMIVGRHGVQTMQAWQDGLRHAASASDYTSAEGSSAGAPAEQAGQGVSCVRVNFWGK